MKNTTELFATETVFEKYEGEPTFPCLFVPMQTDRTNKWYLQWAEADIVEAKIRGVGQYFKIVFISKIEKVR